MKERIEAARRALQEAVRAMEETYERLDKARTAYREAPADAENREDLGAAARVAVDAFGDAEEVVAEERKKLEELERLAAARTAAGEFGIGEDEEEQRTPVPATARTPVTKDTRGLTYHPGGEHSFWADLVNAQVNADMQAATRLAQHNKETQEFRSAASEAAEKAAIERGEVPGLTKRDIITSGGGSGFLPPVYMTDMWVPFPRGKRPFADRCRSIDLPESGLVLTIPKLTGGTAVAARATQGGAVQKTDATSSTVTANVNTIAGQQDMSLEAAERLLPSWDMVIMQDLVNAYDEYLDTQLIAGTGASGQHLGIRAVSGVNAVTFTSGAPTAALTYPKLFSGMGQIEAAKIGFADLIVWHPLRAYWLASSLSSVFPLFQIGNLFQAGGVQAKGVPENVSDIEAIRDVNIATNYGAGTNQDEIYVLLVEQMFLAEGEVRTRILTEVLSGTLQVRLQVYAYSAFVPHRLPAAISVISGTGLTTPAF